jgi:hypothetical protein
MIIPSATAPRTAARLAGPAYRGGVTTAAAAPAVAVALAPNSHGSWSRASLHTGIDVFATSAPVYVASGGPLTADTTSAARLTGARMPSRSSAAAVFDALPDTSRIQLPTLIGDVALNIRNMFRKRSGRPRSLTSRAGETTSATAPMKSARFARGSFPVTCATPCSTADAPAIPPVQKYSGIAIFQTGSLTIFRP